MTLLEGPARTRDRNEFFDVLTRAIRYTAKGVALSFGYKISFRRY
jgi:hypothetical protein